LTQPNDDLCWDWNPGRSLKVEDAVHDPGDLTQTWSKVFAGPPAKAAPSSSRSSMRGLAAPMAAFTIHTDRDPVSLDPERTIGGLDEAIQVQLADKPDAGESPPKGGQGIPFPQIGDGIAGFRLLSELGRGSFGRVFLAEESLLANRLVALKITKPEGDEPHLLARLQHTHIVPIHSVHDDPITGLRVMCMPYFGGANLAQVLEAAEAQRFESEKRSLIKALDAIGRPPQSEKLGPKSPRRRSLDHPSSQVGSFKLLRWNRLGESPPGSTASPDDLIESELAEAHGPDSDPLGIRIFEGEKPTASRSSFLSRIPRLSRSIAAAQRVWPRSKPEQDDDREPVQPARCFLREANFVRAAVWIVARLAEGLEHAHSHGLMHRDLKPSNILIAADGTPMLLDFNLAADTSAKADENDKFRMGGTLPYMAPEHLDAFHPNGTCRPEEVDERSDIYALGLILFEMIAGHRPFPEPAPNRPILETIRAMIVERRAGAPSLRSLNSSVPRDLDAVVRKCLHPDPDRRHARAGDFAEDLRRFLDDQPLKYTTEPTLRGRVRKWLRRNPRVTGASSVALVGIALIIGLSGATWSVSNHLTNVSARLRLKGFESRFPECQFLLNTVGGPAETLGRGITLAEETLQQAGITIDPTNKRSTGGWLDALPADEQTEVRRDLAEVILLVARARTYLADRTHSPEEQRRAVKRAITWLDRAEAIDPSPTLTLYDDRANYLAKIGDLNRAAEDRARRDSISPSSGRDYYLIGTAFLAKGEPDRAEAALIKATGLSPQGFWPWFALGLCHFDQKRFTESAGDFAVCTVLSPRFAWPWVNRGLALARVGRLIEARAAYDRAVEADDSMVDALANRGLVALELGDASAAVDDLAQAVAKGRRDVDIQAALGEALGKAGRKDEAGRLLDKLVAEHPEAVLPRIARGTLHSVASRASAEADFRVILDIDPKHPGALLGLARLRRLSDPNESLRLALRCLEGDPNRVDAVELCAWLRGSLGDPAVVEDVDRLVQSPTANRLYNAACSLALYDKHHPDPNLSERAIGYLRRAVQSGVAASTIRDDPDLTSLHRDPSFRELLAGQPATIGIRP